jgi:cholesterol transport system auxiliary component
MLLIIAVSLSGCGQRKAIVKNYYLVQAQRTASPSAQPSQKTLKVAPFVIGTGFQSKGFVYYLGEQKYETDFYNEYFFPPAQIVAEQTEQWLGDSGLFEQVLPNSSLMDVSHVLEGNVRQIYYDVQREDDVQAVLDVTFYLLSREGRRISTVELSKNYRVTEMLGIRDQQQAANAMSRCLTKVLEKLEQDLKQHMKTK